MNIKENILSQTEVTNEEPTCLAEVESVEDMDLLERYQLSIQNEWIEGGEGLHRFAVRMRESSGKKYSWRFLKEVSDWIGLWELMLEWHDCTPSTIKEVDGGGSFYMTLYKFKNSKEESGEWTTGQARSFWEGFFLRDKTSRRGYLAEDYIAEWERHPEWHGHSTQSIKEFSKGFSFYTSIREFMRAKLDSKEWAELEADNFCRYFFPRKSRTHYSEEDYITEWNQHPEWHELSVKAIDEIEGAESFYVSLCSFRKLKLDSGEWDEDTAEKFRARFFERLTTDRSNYLAEDYIAEWNEHPEWHGRNTEELKEVRGGISFYHQTNKFINSKVERGEWDKDTAEKFRARFFERLTTDRSNYLAEDYIAEWNEHPEWHGRNTQTLKEVRGGISFYHSAKKFKDSKVEKGEWSYKKARNFIAIFIPPQSGFDFGYGPVRFDSRPERLLGIFLVYFGLIDRFIKNQNLHIRTNGSSRHSLDFLIENYFIEYHPRSISDYKEERDHEQSLDRKLNHITNPKYLGNEVLFIWEPEQIYDVLDFLRGEESLQHLVNDDLRNLTRKQFEELLEDFEKMVDEYDREHQDDEDDFELDEDDLFEEDWDEAMMEAEFVEA